MNYFKNFRVFCKLYPILKRSTFPMQSHICFSILFLLLACGAREYSSGQGSTSHSQWTDLLVRHVDDQGMVDYQGFQNDSVLLNQYLSLLSEGPPAEKDEQLAFWINAYNAFTVKLIADNYPVSSIKDLNPVIAIPTVHSVWTKRWFTIGGKEMSLDDIEHQILRKDFNEPRIHFALNCASLSCPKLRREAFIGERIDEQLEAQAIEFINDPARNDLSDPAHPKISRIFSWFTSDFTKETTLVEFINTYANAPVEDDISYLKYDWSLNDQ